MVCRLYPMIAVGEGYCEETVLALSVSHHHRFPMPFRCSRPSSGSILTYRLTFLDRLQVVDVVVEYRSPAVLCFQVPNSRCVSAPL